jgi:hypothetical protein
MRRFSPPESSIPKLLIAWEVGGISGFKNKTELSEVHSITFFAQTLRGRDSGFGADVSGSQEAPKMNSIFGIKVYHVWQISAKEIS